MLIKASNGRVRVIVQLNDAPMAQFDGVNPSISEASAQKNQKISFYLNAAKEYKSFRQNKQQAVIQTIKSSDTLFKSDFSYTTAFNGFARLVSRP